MSTAKVVVIQGAGMDQRGKVQIEIFGPQTLEQINEQIKQAAASSNLQVEIFQSNDEVETVKFIKALEADEYVAGVINPSGFTPTTGPLPQAIADTTFPFYEVHASNPHARGVKSTILPVCKGGICGFGYAGYGMVLQAVAQTLTGRN